MTPLLSCSGTLTTPHARASPDWRRVHAAARHYIRRSAQVMLARWRERTVWGKLRDATLRTADQHWCESCTMF